jgi:hypothetical protein
MLAKVREERYLNIYGSYVGKKLVDKEAAVE